MNQVQQLHLNPAMEEELVLQKARELWRGSKNLSARYATFEGVMADAAQGKCLRLWATALVRRGKRTRG